MGVGMRRSGKGGVSLTCQDPKGGQTVKTCAAWRRLLRRAPCAGRRCTASVRLWGVPAGRGCEAAVWPGFARGLRGIRSPTRGRRRRPSARRRSRTSGRDMARGRSPSTSQSSWKRSGPAGVAEQGMMAGRPELRVHEHEHPAAEDLVAYQKTRPSHCEVSTTCGRERRKARARSAFIARLCHNAIYAFSAFAGGGRAGVGLLLARGLVRLRLAASFFAWVLAGHGLEAGPAAAGLLGRLGALFDGGLVGGLIAGGFCSALLCSGSLRRSLGRGGHGGLEAWDPPSG